MKPINRSGFKSFFRQKLAVVLLGIIIFLSASMFTLFDSSTNNYTKAYNHVIQDGKLHEYTLKEAYQAKGEVHYGVTLDTKNPESKIENVWQNSPVYGHSAIGDLYILSDQDLTANNIDYADWAPQFDKSGTGWFNENPFKTFFAIDTKTIKLIDNNNDHIWDKVEPIGNTISIITNSPMLDSSIKDNLKKYNLKNPIDLLTTTVFNQSDYKHFTYDTQNEKIATTIQGKAVEKNTIKAFHDPGGLSDMILKSLNGWKTKYGINTVSEIVKSQNIKAFNVSPIKNKTTEDFLTTYNGNPTKYDFRAFLPVDNPNDIKESFIPGDTLNKIDKLKATMTNDVKNNLSDVFLNITKNKYPELLMKKIKSIAISFASNNYKVVNNQKGDQVDNFIIENGNKYLDLKNSQEINASIQKFISDHAITNYFVNKTRLWTNTIEYSGSVGEPLVKSFIDPSSFEAIISSSFAKANKIKPISDIKAFRHDMQELYDLDLSKRNNKIDFLKKKYSDSVVNLNGAIVFATGIGITPDFAYPIISENTPIVNVKNQGVIYMNKAGYYRMLDSFKGSPTEDYVGLAFKEGTSLKRKNEVITNLEKDAHKTMSWPSGLQIISSYNDTSEKIILAPQRISFLEELNGTISSVSYIVIFGLIILSALIVSITIKRIIASEKKTLAILNANGYKKMEIASSYLLPSLFIVALSSIFGYVLGLLLQPLFFKIFQDFWTLPLETASFSLTSLIITVVIALVSIIPLVIVFALIEMRGTALKNINNQDSQWLKTFVSNCMRPFKYFGIKTKLAISLTFSNIGKIMLVAFVGTIGISVLTVGLTSAGKFNSAINQTNEVHNYQFAIELASPTKQGGQYVATIPADPNKQKNNWKEKPTRYWLGMDYYDDNDQKIKQGHLQKLIRINDINRNFHSVYHLPSAQDGVSYKHNLGATGWGDNKKYNEAIHFLNHRIQSKEFLNAIMGASIGDGPIQVKTNQINPWDNNKELMPYNQQLQSNIEYINFLREIINNKENTNLFNSKQKIIDFELKHNVSDSTTAQESWWDEINKMLEVDNKIKNTNDITLKGSLQQELEMKIKRIANVIVTSAGNISYLKIRPSFRQAVENVLKTGFYPFLLAYNQITMNINDETYTSIRGETKLKTSNGEKIVKPSIKGINEESRYLLMGENNINKIKNYHGNNVPIVINRFVSKYYNLKVGSSFEIKINNMYTRLNKDFVKPKKNFEVVGIMNSYSKNEFVTLRNVANKLLGYDLVQGFNGVFSGSSKPLALKNVNLYSKSGLYPAFAKFDPADQNAEFTELIKNYLSSQENTLRVKTPTEFAKVFGSTIYSSSINDVEWAKMSEFTFKSVNNLSSSLMLFIEMISIIISIIFIIILGSSLVLNNKKNIAVLKTLGYRDVEIRNTFIKSFVPSIIIGAIFAVPIVFTILATMQFAIMTFGSALIPLTMLGWELITATIIVCIIFMSIFVLSIKNMKNELALNAFKE